MLEIKQGQELVLAVGELATVSLPIYDAEGNLWEVVSGSCFAGSAELQTRVENGIIVATIPPQTSIRQLELAWRLVGSESDATLEISTVLDVVSAHLCSISDIRSYNAGANVDNFEDAELYPNDMVFKARAIATQIIEDACNVFFSQRRRSCNVLAPVPLFSLPHCRVDTVSASNGSVDLVSDCQVKLCEVSEYPVELSYVCGYKQTPPDVSAAVVKLTASILRPLNRPECATGESSELGYITYTLAGRDGATGIPDVDAAIQRYKRERF